MNRRTTSRYILTVVLVVGTLGATGCREKGDVEKRMDDLLQGKLDLNGSVTRAKARACDEGQARACADLGLDLEGAFNGNPEAVPDDVKCLPFDLYERACNERVPAGCFGLGRAFVLGECTEKSMSTGRDLLRLSCADGYELACGFMNKL